MGGCFKMCKKGKKRVRDPHRHEDAAVRLQRAREARATLPPREGSRRAGLAQRDAELSGVVWVWAGSQEAREALDAFQGLVDASPQAKWLVDSSKRVGPTAEPRLQLQLKSQTTSQGLKVAYERVRCAFLQNAPPCPRCGKSLLDHKMHDANVNRYECGSGLSVHVDEEPGVAVLVAMPGRGPHSGGMLRVAPQRGGAAVYCRGEGASCSSLPAKRHRDLVHVPYPAYSACVFDGYQHAHEVSVVSHGVRYSLTLGTTKCQP